MLAMVRFWRPFCIESISIGTSAAAMMPMTAMTSNNSTRVNPERRVRGLKNMFSLPRRPSRASHVPRKSGSIGGTWPAG
jgi:hypothetical protein